MKSYKFLFFSLSVLLAGCAGASENVETSAVSTGEPVETVSKEEVSEPVETMTAPEMTSEQVITSTEAEEDEENFYPMRAGEGKKVFEEGKKYLDFTIDGVSYDYELLNKPKETENPTLAEELYRTLYDFAVFFQYTDPYRLHHLTDQSDRIKVEKAFFENLSDKSQIQKDYVTPGFYIYERVKFGEITTIGEYFSRFFQFASPTFTNSESFLFDEQFVLSDGNLYLTCEPESVSYLMPNADSRLNRIQKILSPTRYETLDLFFTAYYEMYDRPYTEDYTVSLSYDKDYGWRVADCSTSRAVGFLVSEILEGGKDFASPETNLLEEIELWLGQIGLM